MADIHAEYFGSPKFERGDSYNPGATTPIKYGRISQFQCGQSFQAKGGARVLSGAKRESGRDPDRLSVEGLWWAPNRADPNIFSNFQGLERLLTVEYPVAVGYSRRGDGCIRACDLMHDGHHRCAVGISIE